MLFHIIPFPEKQETAHIITQNEKKTQ